ncbi:MAG: alpha/beta hydrolase [Candidatus Magnetoovum sp. WYHC-5]|nr:alpha/beta hydrolase [Candidatus Magnetoovum sp. WYHC-5]
MASINNYLFVTTVKKDVVAYLQEGKGEKAIVFVHGNLAGAIWWKKVLKYIPVGYKAYALDLPGNGQTPETGKRHTMEYLAEFLYDFVTSLKLSSFYLVGHSMGGGIAQLFTIMYGQMVKKLIIVNSMPMDGFPLLNGYGLDKLQSIMDNKDILRMALTAVLGRLADTEMYEEVICNAAKASKQVVLEQPLTMCEANWSERIHLITCPTLSIHAEEDYFVPKEINLKTAHAIRNCTILLMKNTGHSPMIEAPREFTKIIMDFIEKG